MWSQFLVIDCTVFRCINRPLRTILNQFALALGPNDTWQIAPERTLGGARPRNCTNTFFVGFIWSISLLYCLQISILRLLGNYFRRLNRYFRHYIFFTTLFNKILFLTLDHKSPFEKRHSSCDSLPCALLWYQFLCRSTLCLATLNDLCCRSLPPQVVLVLMRISPKAPSDQLIAPLRHLATGLLVQWLDALGIAEEGLCFELVIAIPKAIVVGRLDFVRLINLTEEFVIQCCVVMWSTIIWRHCERSILNLHQIKLSIFLVGALNPFFGRGAHDHSAIIGIFDRFSKIITAFNSSILAVINCLTP